MLRISIGSIFFVFLFGGSFASASGESPVLVVPASKEALHVAIDLPPKSESKSGWQLVEIDRPGRPLAAQAICGIAADGAVKRDRVRLLAEIPPAGDEAARGDFACKRPEATRHRPPYSLSPTTKPRRFDSRSTTSRCWRTTMA